MAATVRDGDDGGLPGAMKNRNEVIENHTSLSVTVDEPNADDISRAPKSSSKWKSLKTLVTAGNALTSSTSGTGSSQRSASRQSAKRKLRESSFRAVKDARGGAAVKSRQSLGFGLASVYFQVLERSWAYVTLVLAGSFLVSLLVCALLCFVVGGYADANDGKTAPLRFAASHVFTMGFGTVTPRSDVSYALAVAQCFLGVILNVFMFTFVITKFQRPNAAMMLSDKLCLCTRAGEPFLLVRFANLRCNTLQKAHITLTLMRRRKTPEGEDYVARTKLSTHEPPTTLTAFATVAHRVAERGPGSVFRKLQYGSVDLRDLADLLIQVVVSAYDPIYDKEICAVKVYGAGDVAVGCVFRGMMGTDEKGAHPVVNFEKISDVETQTVTVFPPAAESSDAPVSNRSHRNTKLELVLGGGRGSVGPNDPNFPNLGPRSPLEQMCGYCAKLLMVLGEGGAAFSSKLADITDDKSKPSWLERCNPKKEAPCARLPGSTKWIAGTDDIMAAVGATHAGVAAVLARKRPDVTSADETLLRSFMWLWITAVCVGPDTSIPEMVAKGGMAVFMLVSAGVYDPNAHSGDAQGDRTGSTKAGEKGGAPGSPNKAGDEETDVSQNVESTTVKSVLNARAVLFLQTLERLLSGTQHGRYLCGDEPGKLDFWVFADTRALLDDCFMEWLDAHGVPIAQHVGRATKKWLAALREKPHVKHSMGAGYSDGVLASTRTILAKCFFLSPFPGFPRKDASNVFLEKLKLAHPPATLWSHENGGASGVVENGAIGEASDTAMDSAAARLCV